MQTFKLREYFATFLRFKGISVTTMKPVEMPAWCRHVLKDPELPAHVPAYINQNGQDMLLVFSAVPVFKELTFALALFEQGKPTEAQFYVKVKGEWIPAKPPDNQM